MAQLPAIGSTPCDRRFPIRLQVRVEGKDSQGNNFRQEALTIDVSRTGARLAPLQRQVPVNALLNVEYGTRKARCRVVWQGKTSDEQGQLGIRCLDEDQVPWLELITMNSDSANSDAPPESTKTAQIDSPGKTWPAHERRRAPRYSCNLLVTIRRLGDSFTTSARLTDVSQTGGYLETMSPMAVGTEINLVLEAGNRRISVIGVVRTCHPGMGNGVAFTKVSLEAMELLQQFLATLAPPEPQNAGPLSGAGEELRDRSHRSGVLESQVEALVELLEQKSILTRDELLRHLEQKTRKG